MEQLTNQLSVINATIQTIHQILLESQTPSETARTILRKIRFPPYHKMSTEAYQLVCETMADLSGLAYKEKTKK